MITLEIVEERGGEYLPDDIEGLLADRREENICERLGSLIEELYR